jgi:hypothetical protein
MLDGAFVTRLEGSTAREARQPEAVERLRRYASRGRQTAFRTPSVSGER